ncbi:MAG TPA: hypothetical protein VEJ39_05305 [Candidatus Acidoferrales bacterium]|nr:hypothetical protein [Candidatus Acidoferrales bacterium]
MTTSHKSPKPAAPETSLDAAVNRALRDNLAPLQRTLEELQQAYADLSASCASSRAANAIPAMLRAQSAAASLSASLGVLAHFVTVALQPRDRASAGASVAAEMLASAVSAPHPIVHPQVPEEEAIAAEEAAVADEFAPAESLDSSDAAALSESAPPSSADASFDVGTLDHELQELHRRAKRVAKVAMQDIKMLRPKDVRLAQQNKDICVRLRDDLDKARKEYDRRFKAILDHPVDHFHDWMVTILADGDPEALGEYPYPSPVARH